MIPNKYDYSYPLEYVTICNRQIAKPNWISKVETKSIGNAAVEVQIYVCKPIEIREVDRLVINNIPMGVFTVGNNLAEFELDNTESWRCNYTRIRDITQEYTEM